MSAGRFIAAGAVFGGLAWWLWQAQKQAPVDTADGEAMGLASGGDSLIDAGFSLASYVSGGDMQISLAGLYAIKKQEGYSAKPYQDIAGYWTGGYGHKLGAMESKAERTESEWEQILARDIAAAEIAVNTLVSVPLQQNQYDALVSFVYNVGAGAFRRSTMLALLNAGDYQGAASQFARWNKAGGKVVQGLANRRLAEANLFKGVASA